MNVKIAVTFQKPNASNVLTDIAWANGTSTQTTFNGSGPTLADAKAQVATAFAPFATAAQNAAADAAAAVASLG